MVRIIGLLLGCMFGVGCSSLNVQKPTATVTGMAVQNVNAADFTMNFDVDVANPNSMALPLTAADYQLDLSGMKVVEGKTPKAPFLRAGLGT